MFDYSAFEKPEVVEVSVTVKGKTGIYLVREMSAGEMQEIHSESKAKEDADADLGERLIAACVSRPDGRKVTREEAANMRAPLRAKLQEAITEVNGFGANAEEEAKNE